MHEPPVPHPPNPARSPNQAHSPNQTRSPCPPHLPHTPCLARSPCPIRHVRTEPPRPLPSDLSRPIRPFQPGPPGKPPPSLLFSDHHSQPAPPCGKSSHSRTSCIKCVREHAVFRLKKALPRLRPNPHSADLGLQGSPSAENCRQLQNLALADTNRGKSSHSRTVFRGDVRQHEVLQRRRLGRAAPPQAHQTHQARQQGSFFFVAASLRAKQIISKQGECNPERSKTTETKPRDSAEGPLASVEGKDVKCSPSALSPYPHADSKPR